MPTDTMNRLLELLKKGGRCTTVYLDLSEDRENPEGLLDSRRRSIRDEASKQGATEAACDVIDAALSTPSRMPSPRSRFLVVCDDTLEIDETLPGTPKGTEFVHVGPIPVLLPVLEHRLEEFTYLVIQVARDGGDIEARTTGSFGVQLSESHQGRTDTLHKTKGGGWSHLRYQHHVERIWKQTQAELAVEVDRIVLDLKPRLIVVSGDVYARQYLLESLADRSRGLVVEYPRETRAEGSEDSPFEEFIEEQVAAVFAKDEADALDRLRAALGRPEGFAEQGVAMAVFTLMQAQVDTLFVDPEGLGDRELLILDAAPWVASAPEEAEATDAGIIGRGPAAEALVRAALLTDATVRFAPSTKLQGAEVAMLLRWPARTVQTQEAASNAPAGRGARPA